MIARYAAVLANGGMSIEGHKRLFAADVVRNVLCVMYSSGMYEYSGRWSSDIGLPAKSGVSGLLLVVVPNLCGVCVFSPRLDNIGNSVRGIAFMRQLCQRYSLHVFDTLIRPPVTGVGACKKKSLLRQPQADLFRVCAGNDLRALRSLLLAGPRPCADYDKRTPLHIALDDGATECADCLVRIGCSPCCRDRWGKSPLASRGRGDRVYYLMLWFRSRRVRAAWSAWSRSLGETQNVSQELERHDPET